MFLLVVTFHSTRLGHNPRFGHVWQFQSLHHTCTFSWLVNLILNNNSSVTVIIHKSRQMFHKHLGLKAATSLCMILSRKCVKTRLWLLWEIILRAKPLRPNRDIILQLVSCCPLQNTKQSHDFSFQIKFVRTYACAVDEISKDVFPELLPRVLHRKAKCSFLKGLLKRKQLGLFTH